jgi:hypothetical protein
MKDTKTDCWLDMLTGELEANGETLKDIEANTMGEEDMKRKFDSGFGMAEGCPFTVWTKSKVYFPCEYDGAESVGCVSRHPDGKPTKHLP